MTPWCKDAVDTAHSPKLYFVKLDVQACFDTIEQSKLLGILKNLITEVGSNNSVRYGVIDNWLCINSVYT